MLSTRNLLRAFIALALISGLVVLAEEFERDRQRRADLTNLIAGIQAGKRDVMMTGTSPRRDPPATIRPTR